MDVRMPVWNSRTPCDLGNKIQSHIHAKHMAVTLNPKPPLTLNPSVILTMVVIPDTYGKELVGLDHTTAFQPSATMAL
jgi:hypothetical protein